MGLPTLEKFKETTPHDHKTNYSLPMRHLNIFFGTLILGLTFFAGGVFFTEYNIEFSGIDYVDSGASSDSSSILNNPFSSDISSFDNIKSYLEDNYLYPDRLEDEEKLKEGAIRGMINSLDDPYTSYLTEEEFQNFETNLSGEFEGIGAQITIREDQLTVVTPLDASPASKAGLKPNDEILAIDQESTEGVTLEEAVQKIRGEQGSEVTLTINRESESQPQEVDITRDVIDVPNVTTEIEDNVGIVSIGQFQQDTARDVEEAMDSLQDDGIDKVILDLRFNPGGFLTAAVQTIDLFIDKDQVIVQEQTSNEKIINKEKSRTENQYPKVDLVVLVNEGSASASEILSGALRDIRDVPIVGKTTFGKGVVQTTERLEDGSVIKYSKSQWLTPNGDQIDTVGIEPDEDVAIEQEDIDALQNDQEVLDAQEKRAIELLTD